MEKYIITRDLRIINMEIGIPSFETNRGRSLIDLTLCNSKLTQNIRWTCWDKESFADHKIICFDIESRSFKGNATHYLQEALQYKSR
jgi:hypothetical protein